MSAQFPLPLPFLRTQEAARFVGLSCRTLEKQIGGRIIYAVSDLREWAERGARRSTSDPAVILPAKPVNKRAAKSDGGVR